MHDEDSSSVWATNTLHLRAFPDLLSHGVLIFFCWHCLRLVQKPPALAMREASALQKIHNQFYVNIVKKIWLLSQDYKSSEQFTCFNHRYHEMKAE